MCFHSNGNIREMNGWGELSGEGETPCIVMGHQLPEGLKFNSSDLCV